MTMPTLISKHQKQVTVTKLKKAYSILGQVVVKSFADNGPIELSGNVSDEKTEKFFKTYWFPYFNNVTLSPDEKNIFFYGGSSDQVYKQKNGDLYKYSIYTNYGAGRVLFSANDGMIFFIDLMNWSNEYDDDGNILSSTPVYKPDGQLVFVDINGSKGPNILGKDVFVFVIEFDKNIVRGAIADCDNSGFGCARKIMEDGWQITYPW